MTLYSFWLGGFVVIMGLNLAIMVEAKVTRPLMVAVLVVAAVAWPFIMVGIFWTVWRSNLS